MRQAHVYAAPADVEPYLPSNYKVACVLEDRSGDILRSNATVTVIYGEDVAGWTLDGYVIPRLASGLLHAVEVER